MSAENFKNLNERDFKLLSFSVLIADKQQIFWKKSSRIFIILLFLLKFSRVFKIILYSFADLRFIIRFTFYDLTAIIQLRNCYVFNNMYQILKIHRQAWLITINCSSTTWQLKHHVISTDSTSRQTNLDKFDIKTDEFQQSRQRKSRDKKNLICI